MSSPVAFSVLVNSVRIRSNTENRTGLVTSPEVREYLNEGLAEFVDLLVSARGQEHIRKASNFTTVGGTSAYALPSDFYELISIDIQLSPNQYHTATPYMEGERNAFRLYPAWAGWYMSMPVYWRILGSAADANAVSVTEKTLNFIPTPQASFPITLNYIYAFPRFDTAGAQDTNVIDSVNGWTDYAVWYAVCAVKHKLKEDPSFAMARMSALQARINEMAPQNAAGDAERIKDVFSEYDASIWWQ